MGVSGPAFACVPLVIVEFTSNSCDRIHHFVYYLQFTGGDRDGTDSASQADIGRCSTPGDIHAHWPLPALRRLPVASRRRTGSIRRDVLHPRYACRNPSARQRGHRPRLGRCDRGAASRPSGPRALITVAYWSVTEVSWTPPRGGATMKGGTPLRAEKFRR
jgi:hypothetical protein